MDKGMPEYRAYKQTILLDMSTVKQFKADLRSLDYSPDANPLIDAGVVPIKKKRVRSGLAETPLVDPKTGEIAAASVIHQIEEQDSDQFVKVFSAGIAAAYDLSKTGHRVFQAVLQEYEKTPMHGGFADTVYLAWFGGGLSGRDIGMSEYTFKRGMRELLDKQFIAARGPNAFWVNPALFFKGDRVMFVKEYRRKTKTEAIRDPNTVDMLNGKTDAEEHA